MGLSGARVDDCHGLLDTIENVMGYNQVGPSLLLRYPHQPPLSPTAPSLGQVAPHRCRQLRARLTWGVVSGWIVLATARDVSFPSLAAESLQDQVRWQNQINRWANVKTHPFEKNGVYCWGFLFREGEYLVCLSAHLVQARLRAPGYLAGGPCNLAIPRAQAATPQPAF